MSRARRIANPYHVFNAFSREQAVTGGNVEAVSVALEQIICHVGLA